MGLASAPGAPGKGFIRQWCVEGGRWEFSKSGAMRFVFVFKSKRIEPGTASCKDTWSVSRSNSTGRSSAGGDANLVLVIGLNVL